MSRSHVRHLPVSDDIGLVGMRDITDVCRALIDPRTSQTLVRRSAYSPCAPAQTTRAGNPPPTRQTLAGLAARVRLGGPAPLALRIAITAAVTAAASAVVGAQPAAGGLAVGTLTWLLLTARDGLTPPAT